MTKKGADVQAADEAYDVALAGDCAAVADYTGGLVILRYVNNQLAVTANAGGPYAGNEGAHITLDARGTTNKDRVATYKWDCMDDGIFEKSSRLPVEKSCKYADNGSYTVRLTVTDDDGAAGSAALTVTVRTAPPTLSDVTLSATEIDEGGRFTLSGNMSCAIVDSPLTLQIDWGDGDTATHQFAAGSSCFSITHTCADDNPSLTAADVYTIELTLRDASGAFSREMAVIQVNNVAPTVNAGPDKVTLVDDSVEFSAAISDPGHYDTHTITWDFGDGSPMANGTKVTHKFASAGTFTVTVTATDDDGGVGQDTVKVVVNELRQIYFPLVFKNQTGEQNDLANRR